MIFALILIVFIPGSISVDAPIVGVLSQETFSVSKIFKDRKFDSYIAGSYVKFLESGGARVVPIWIGQDREYYERVINFTNGILLPGGATYFNETGGYGDAVRFIYEIAKELNDNGTHYPILGICLGMQALAFASTKGKDIRIDCYAKKISNALTFAIDFHSSKLFKDVPAEVVDILQTKNVTYNYHRYCLTDDTLVENNLTDIWRVISRNEDSNGLKYISTMENKKYPFYGLQFHPEKSRFEFKSSMNIPHDVYSNIASQYFAEFFVENCKKNKNQFPDEKLELNSLIYNFNPVFTARNSSYFQMYMFTKNDFDDHLMN